MAGSRSSVQAIRQRKADSGRTLTIALSLGYILQDADRKNGFDTEPKITELLVRGAVAAKFPAPAGIKDPFTQELWAEIQDAIGLAVQEGKEEIQLSADKVRWVFLALTEWGVPAMQSSWFVRLKRHLKDLLDEDRQAPVNGNGSPELPKE